MIPDLGDGLAGQISALDVGDAEDGPRRPQPPFGNYNEEPPPAPHIHSKGIVATDITVHFIKAAEELDVGQLIKDDFFTLFESVGAIELMDPKMDTGFLAEGHTMEDDYDITREVLPEEILGIIDQLLCLEMAWHMGHPLSQTIFTSLYIDRILGANPGQEHAFRFGFNDSVLDEPPTHKILQAYCLGLIKTCWHVNNRVKSEHFYEEEDFVTHTYNRSLLDDIDDDIILECLEDAFKVASSSDKSTVWEALAQRIRFRTTFLKTVSIASDRTSTEIEALWDKLLELLPGIKTARDQATSVPESFSARLQRKLASTVPPRPAVTVAYEAAYSHLERLCQDGQAMTKVLKYHDSQSLITFVALFQARNPQPSVFIRTLLQYYIFGDMIILGTMSVRQVIDEDLTSIVLPDHQLLDRNNDDIEVPSDPRHNMATRMELFRSRAAQSFLDILRTLCQNRCRIRRTLHHTIADWDILQLDTEEIDAELRAFTQEKPIVDPSVSPEPIYSFPLSSWCYLYKLRQMEWSLQMGFELEVFQPDELAGMYWYLQHLASTRIRHLDRIRLFVRKAYKTDKPPQKSTTPNALSQEKFESTLSFINASMLEATAMVGFADALSSLYTVLLRLDLIPTPSLPYSNDTIRYELRMKSFLSITLPELVPHADFQAAVMQPCESNHGIITYAAAAAQRARKDLELLAKLDAKTARYHGSEEAWRANVKNCLKACIMTSISISTANKALEVGAAEASKRFCAEVPKAGEGYHDWWAVPKITPI